MRKESELLDIVFKYKEAEYAKVDNDDLLNFVRWLDEQNLLSQPAVSGSLPNGWLDFKAGFEMARDYYNEKLATPKKRWILLPDKAIANAFWKHNKGNDR